MLENRPNYTFVGNSAHTLATREEERDLSTLVAMYRAGLAVIDTRDPEQLWPRVVQLAMEALGADDASLMLADGEGLRLACSHRLGSSGAEVEPRIAKRVAELREPVILTGGPRRDSQPADSLCQNGVRSSIVFPLVKDDRLLGVLNVNRIDLPAPFTSSDLQRATVLASMIVLSLDNARLFQELEQRVAELSSTHAQLVHSEKMAAFGQLAAGVAHEINNPAAFICTNLSQLEQQVAVMRELLLAGLGGATTDELRRLGQERDIQSILGEVTDVLEETSIGFTRIVGIVDELRSFARIAEQTHMRFPLQLAVESALRLCRNELQQRARLRVQLPADIVVEGNQSQLCQVFLNLLLNAVQALDERERVGNQVGVSMRRSGEWAEVDVTDTGCGIVGEEIPRLCEPFYTTKSRSKGTGLGLTISREIVEKHGGKLHVTSRPGKGSCFTVRLPLVESAAQEPAASASVARQGQRLRLLVVDDEPALLRSLRRVLGRRHDVLTADSGEEALRILRQDLGIDGVVCDLLMPGVTGMEVYTRACAQNPGLEQRFVFLTGDAFTPAARTFAKRHREQLMLKPFDLGELERLIQRVAIAGEDAQQ